MVHIDALVWRLRSLRAPKEPWLLVQFDVSLSPKQLWPSAGLCSLHSTTPVDFRDHGGALGILGFVMAITTGSVQVNWNVEIFMLYCYIYYSPVLSVQEYEWLEYFAGLGNLTKCMKSAMYKSARFDLLDNLHPEHYKSNFMDLNSASGFAPLAHNFNWILVGFSIALKLSTVDRFVLRRGFWFQRVDSWLLPRHPCQRLAILCMLRTVAADFCAHFGLKCSSFCRVNVGTSYRSACTAIGLHFYKSVASSNKLLERIGVNLTCLGTCMGMINRNHFKSWMRFFASANQQPVQDMPFGIALHSTGGVLDLGAAQWFISVLLSSLEIYCGIDLQHWGANGGPSFSIQFSILFFSLQSYHKFYTQGCSCSFF